MKFIKGSRWLDISMLECFCTFRATLHFRKFHYAKFKAERCTEEQKRLNLYFKILGQFNDWKGNETEKYQKYNVMIIRLFSSTLFQVNETFFKLISPFINHFVTQCLKYSKAPQITITQMKKGKIVSVKISSSRRD